MTSLQHDQTVVYDIQYAYERFTSFVWRNENATAALDDLWDLLDGKRDVKEPIQPILVDKYREESSKGANDLPWGDTGWLTSGFLVLSQRAVDELADIIRDAGILLQVDCREAPTPYWLLHVTRMIDALDVANSDLKRFPDGRINRLVKPVFDPDRLTGVSLFRIPGYRGGLFATESFRRQVEKHGLTGFQFDQLYPAPSDDAIREKYRAKRRRRK